MRPRTLSLTLVCGIAACLIGCETESTSLRTASPNKTLAAKSADGARTTGASSAPRTAIAGATVSESMAFPSGKGSGSVIQIDQTMPAEVPLNKSFSFEIRVTNLSQSTLREVTVIDDCASNFKMVSSEPAVSGGSTGSPVWLLGDLAGRESKTITVSGTASSAGKLTSCAKVSFSSMQCLTSEVVQPALKLTLSAPSETLLCDSIPLKAVVTNTGTGTVTNAKITATLPAGLKTPDGKSTFEVVAGNLAAGQSREVIFSARAEKIGSYSSKVDAASEGGLTSASDPVSTTVRQPLLTLTGKSSKTQFIGRDMNFEFTVLNIGDAAAPNTVVAAPIPANCTFVKASDGGASTGSVVTWQLGSLPADQPRTLTMTVKPNGAGDFRTNATATGACSVNATADCSTSVVGIPAMMLEVIDISDPIEVGSTETYVITVTNQGSAPDANIKIVADLPEEMQFVSTAGASFGTANGRTVTFTPLATLAPKAKAEWRLTVKALTPGDIRFKVSMTSDHLKRPVEETEASNLYK